MKKTRLFKKAIASTLAMVTIASASLSASAVKNSQNLFVQNKIDSSLIISDDVYDAKIAIEKFIEEKNLIAYTSVTDDNSKALGVFKNQNVILMTALNISKLKV